MNLIAMLLYGDGFVVAVTHGAKLPAQELLLFLCRVDADFDNLNNPRLKARGFLTRCRLSRNSQGF